MDSSFNFINVVTTLVVAQLIEAGANEADNAQEDTFTTKRPRHK